MGLLTKRVSSMVIKLALGTLIITLWHLNLAVDVFIQCYSSPIMAIHYTTGVSASKVSILSLAILRLQLNRTIFSWWRLLRSKKRFTYLYLIDHHCPSHNELFHPIELQTTLHLILMFLSLSHGKIPPILLWCSPWRIKYSVSWGA
jgi:hypothetical protein